MGVDAIRHWLLDYTLVAIGVFLVWFIHRSLGWKNRRLTWIFTSALVLIPFLFNEDRVPTAVARVSQAGFLGLLLLLICLAIWSGLRKPAVHSPSRRRLLVQTAAPALAAMPAAFGCAAVMSARSAPRLDETEVPIPGLPRELHGLRIVQLSDLHFGAFYVKRDLDRAIGLANDTKAHLAVVTGDLITFHDDDLETPIRMLRKLRADAGVYGCHGNHERNAGRVEDADRLTELAGIRILRQRAESLRFGGAELRLAGVDYMAFHQDLPQEAAALAQPGTFNLLLSHNPSIFPSARQAGFQLTLSGHTHGGQLNLEIARHNLNIARVFTPYVRGLYTEGGKSVYVSSGLGTVGAPIRLGAPPEVSLIRLCAV